MEPQYFFNFDKLAYVTGKRPTGCILCAVRDDSPEVVSLAIASSRHFLVCINMYPFNPGHVLVFPRRHVHLIQDLDDAEALDLHHTNCILLDVLKTTCRAAGFNIGWNMGQVAGASIEHLHQHIIPRHAGEIGMAELIAGQRVLVEEPRESARRLRVALELDGRLEVLHPKES